MDPPAADHGRVDEVGDAQRVVDRRGTAVTSIGWRSSYAAIRPSMIAAAAAAAGVPGRTQPLAVRGRDERPVRRVERDEREVREPGAQDDLCRLRIDPDVELGGGRRVPGLVGAAHDDRLRDALDDPRLEPDGQRDVGERTDRHQHDLVGRGEIRVDEELRGTPRVLDGARRRDRQLARMHAAVAVEDLARDREVVAQKRRGRPLVDRDVDAEQVEHAQRVVGAGRRPGCCR